MSAYRPKFALPRRWRAHPGIPAAFDQIRKLDVTGLGEANKIEGSCLV